MVVFLLPAITTMMIWLLTEPFNTLEVEKMWEWDGWQAMEALGSVFAISVALLVAIVGWRIDIGKDARQRRGVRYLLAREIREDRKELGNLEDWERCISDGLRRTVEECRTEALNKSLQELRHLLGENMPPVDSCATSLVRVHRHTKEVTEQLGLLIVALEPRELAELDTFYDGMHVIHERHDNLLKHKLFTDKQHKDCGEDCQLVLYQELARAHHVANSLLAFLDEAATHDS